MKQSMHAFLSWCEHTAIEQSMHAFLSWCEHTAIEQSMHAFLSWCEHALHAASTPQKRKLCASLLQVLALLEFDWKIIVSSQLVYIVACILFPFLHAYIYFPAPGQAVGSQVSSLLPPGSCLQFSSRRSNPTTRRFFIECCTIVARLVYTM